MYFFSCPFFRNEIGGEEERVVSLTRNYSPSQSKHSKGPCHRPPLSCGVSILEYPIGETGWNDGTCPYRRNTKTIENVDEGALYFRNYFYKQGNLSTSSHYHIAFLNIRLLSTWTPITIHKFVNTNVFSTSLYSSVSALMASGKFMSSDFGCHKPTSY